MLSINLTESAIREVKRIRSKYDDPNMCLRLGVKPSGCSGMSYTMGFESDPKEADEIFDFDGCKVVVDPLSLSIIDGMTVDFSEDLLGGGFRFDNPNAANTCGCGTSFAVGSNATAAAATAS
ncbi:iron-sulfur cluster assembly accessory protein [Synechococcus sp. PCC 7336]|uniref:HesB/IscA family protein n=1 Tax=Synechococcus sp. PCC 7336 TaxID=195250 RepID=UPI00034A3BDD|nr:iron-sulfur cluster assembly accessory protein [Synechococcus sp. PCC 7336]